MKIKLFLTCSMMAVSSFIFAQENVQNNIKLKSDAHRTDKKSETMTYTGNVCFDSPYLTFENADKVIVDTKTQDIKIYNPKNLKLINIETIEKKTEKREFIVFNTKTKSLTW